jgi:hypothetical protein
LAQCRREEVVQLFVEPESCGNHWTSIAPGAGAPAPRPASPPRSHSHLCSGRNEALAESRTPAIYGRWSTLSRRRSNVAPVPKAAVHMTLRRTAKADRVRCCRLVGTFCRDLQVMRTFQFLEWLGVDLRYVAT